MSRNSFYKDVEDLEEKEFYVVKCVRGIHGEEPIVWGIYSDSEQAYKVATQQTMKDFLRLEQDIGPLKVYPDIMSWEECYKRIPGIIIEDCRFWFYEVDWYEDWYECLYSLPDKEKEAYENKVHIVVDDKPSDAPEEINIYVRSCATKFFKFLKRTRSKSLDTPLYRMAKKAGQLKQTAQAPGGKDSIASRVKRRRVALEL